MKGKFSTSEKFFLVVGMVLVAGGTYLLRSGHSFVPAQLETQTDPFAATYTTPVAAPALQPETTAEPAPVFTPTPKPKPKPKHTEKLKLREKAYLLFPKAHAFIGKSNIGTTPYSLIFKFEVDPKKTPCTFELQFEDKIILSKKLKASPSGTFQLRVQFKKPGKYSWQILTAHSKSEKRDVIIKP